MKGQPYIYTLPEQFITDKSVPLHWKLYTLINGFWIAGNEVFASNAFFASKLGCSERYIQDCLAKLEDMKLLRRTGVSQQRRILPWGTNQQFVGGRTDSSKGDELTVHHISDSNSVSIKGDLYEVRKESEKETNSLKGKDNIIPTPYSPERTRDLWLKGERRLQVLSWFMTETGLWSKATNPVKLKQIMNRHSNAAKRIADADWELSEVKEARKKIKFNPSLEGEWTLETVEKYLTK